MFEFFDWSYRNKGRKLRKLNTAAGSSNSVAYIIMKFYMEGEEPTTPETPVETPTE